MNDFVKSLVLIACVIVGVLAIVAGIYHLNHRGFVKVPIEKITRVYIQIGAETNWTEVLVRHEKQ